MGRPRRSVGAGSPPRRRGKDVHDADAVEHTGITPAWAGKRWFYSPLPCSRRDHPRVGGEKKQCSLLEDNGVGSPPHGRGKVLTNGLVHGIDGITPARRGKVDVLFWGLVDGRITPAQAGKMRRQPGCPRPRQDHPRVGGEKLGLLGGAGALVGSPPRGRGKEPRRPSSQDRHGITPAWAGKRLYVLRSAS